MLSDTFSFGLFVERQQFFVRGTSNQTTFSQNGLVNENRMTCNVDFINKFCLNLFGYGEYLRKNKGNNFWITYHICIL